MKTITFEILDAAILLENTLSSLYNHFTVKFPKDRNFWFELQLEEKNHAMLLKTAKDFAAIDKVPEEILLDSEAKYHYTIDEINNFIERKKKLTRYNAFEFAYKMEMSSGEIHFQQAMNKKKPDHIMQIFIRLNALDMNHAKRIWKYWHSKTPDQNKDEN